MRSGSILWVNHSGPTTLIFSGTTFPAKNRVRKLFSVLIILRAKNTVLLCVWSCSSWKSKLNIQANFIQLYRHHYYQNKLVTLYMLISAPFVKPYLLVAMLSSYSHYQFENIITLDILYITLLCANYVHIHWHQGLNEAVQYSVICSELKTTNLWQNMDIPVNNAQNSTSK